MRKQAGGMRETSWPPSEAFVECSAQGLEAAMAAVEAKAPPMFHWEGLESDNWDHFDSNTPGSRPVLNPFGHCLSAAT
jgi:hypothetical protein